MDNQILMIKAGTVSDYTISQLRKSGVVVVPITETWNAQFIAPDGEKGGLSPDREMMLRCAMEAIGASQIARETFGAAMSKALSAKP